VPHVELIESRENYGRFSAEPLDKGLGTTLGNSLRRILLGFLPGAAITSLKIDGIQHEFSTIPNVKEDTIELMLNIKAIRLKPNVERPGRLLLEVQKEGPVHASDIKPSDEFEIVNPDQYLATLDTPDARVNVEMNAEIGEGYRQADTNANLPIGMIPIDAIFTPIRKVNFTVEPMHLGRESSRERMFLEVWTDGTILPIDAVSQAANLLVQQLSPFGGLSGVAAGAAEKKGPATTVSDEHLNMPVEELDLSVRTMNSLRRGGITTVGDLLSKGEKELLGLRNFGLKSRQEVQEKLKALGLSLSFETDKGKEATEDYEPAAGGADPETVEAKEE
jgi:DNA-directed RNA polymerase subunit alpha